MKQTGNKICRIGLFGLIGLISAAQTTLAAPDTTLHGFVDGRVGMRTRNDPYEDDRNLTELRAQLDALTYFDRAELQLRADLLYDDLADDLHKVDLTTGDGFIDLREFNLLFSPVGWADLKLGRQILTWGTGDLLFINDLFPKDWNALMLGRDEDYLKAPSDALYASLFPTFATIDIAYMPRFNPDRFVDGRRVSYWNPNLPRLAGQDTVIDPKRRDAWYNNDELAVRVYRNIEGHEAAIYGYHGYWKSPVGVDNGKAYHPKLNTYGASLKGGVGDGLYHLETGYYHSIENNTATQRVPLNEIRFLCGYERELAKELTASAQYYVEHNDDDNRHVLTLRLTKMAMNQNLTLSLFTFYSPSDQDAYFRPAASYKISDHWIATASGNLFVGKENDTFYGQFENNSNLNLGLRYNF